MNKYPTKEGKKTPVKVDKMSILSDAITQKKTM
jgi:hypothetical protein